MYEHGYVINAVDGLKTKDPVPWDRYAAAFDGSSFLQVPPLLKFFTLGIEYHHIHHLDIRVPVSLALTLTLTLTLTLPLPLARRSSSR